jgi:hydroxypyruvate isomerase
MAAAGHRQVMEDRGREGIGDTRKRCARVSGGQGLRFAVNCSTIFTELPLPERPAAARAAGFSAVEFWWPWPGQPVPPDREVEAFARAVEDAGVRLVGLNFFAGDPAGPDAGVLSVPAREREFRDNIEVAIALGERLGTEVFNALYGIRVPGESAARQDSLAAQNLAMAAEAAARIGATVLLEAVSGPKPYPLRTAADVLTVISRVRREHGTANLAFLADLYHLAVNGEDLSTVIATCAASIGHVQIADAPGRHQPGTGTLGLQRHLAALARAGYPGWVALEYFPAGPSAGSFGWLATVPAGEQEGTQP